MLHKNIIFFLLLVAGNLESGEPNSRKNFMPCKLLWHCSKGNSKKQWHHHYKIIYTPIQILLYYLKFCSLRNPQYIIFFEIMYLTENHQEHVDIIQNYKYRRNALLCPFISLAQWIGCNQFLYQKTPPRALRRAFLAWFWTLWKHPFDFHVESFHCQVHTPPELLPDMIYKTIEYSGNVHLSAPPRGPQNAVTGHWHN